MEPYSRFIDLMRTEGAAYNDFPLEVVPVISMAPLTICYNDTPISSGIVCQAGMFTLKDPSSLSTDEPALKAYLTEIYKVLAVKTGDYVFVKRAGDEFYILGKAVRA